MAEDLADYLKELGVKVQYLHSEVDTLERVAILRDLRLGVFDVLVGSTSCARDRPARGDARRDPRRRQGGLPAELWSLIQMIGRAARNIGGKVVMYADRTTESMAAAIEETNRRRAIQEPTTRAGHRADDDRQGDPRHQRAAPDGRRVDDRLHLGARGDGRPGADAREHRRDREARDPDGGRDAGRGEGARVRAGAALRDEIQQIRLRVLEQDQSVIVGRAAERAAARGGGLVDAADRKRSALAAAEVDGPAFEVTSVTVLPADEEPAANLDGVPGIDENTAADWLPGIKDEHDDDGTGWQARWLDRPTWDRTVTPNVRRRTGTRPPRRRR
jgi:excinuclease ABC subunit B